MSATRLVKERRLDASVLVPVVERADSLREIHADAARVIERLGVSYEYLILISAPFPNALREALALQQEDPGRVRVLRFGRAVGESAALATGFERSRGEVVFTLPAYRDADPEALEALWTALQEGADLAFAWRRGRREGALKRAQSLGFNRLVSWATGTGFADIASGTRAIRREVLNEIPVYGDFHRFLPVLAERVGFAVREVPVAPDPRARAPRLYSPSTYLWRLIDVLSVFFLSRFTRRPLRLFGAVGSLFGVAGAAILGVVGVQRLLGTPLADRPILVLGTLLVGLGVQAVTIGLLGELLIFFHARELRDYRVAEVHEASIPPLPEREEAD